MIDIIDIRSRVYAGAMILSFTRSDPWWNVIDPDALDLDSISDCILGQLYETFGGGLKALDMDLSEAHDSGFYVPLFAVNKDLDQLDEEYKALTKEWRTLITQLREADTAEVSLAF
ncbi:hypothetical protein [Actinomadura sp. WMMB 499]|uniref:hypothetical protein n=1 Tax=Actinomadura sp. WMMB 499 TaxID=1219491 RepID=UPI00124690EF|nr:hypothetical protein [Actinomadura sp. WMMB 499]QFG25420.1 hypothetical protein F7P10_33950 [Actinomadura sp. WMMB 499]